MKGIVFMRKLWMSWLPASRQGWRCAAAALAVAFIPGCAGTPDEASINPKSPFIGTGGSIEALPSEDLSVIRSGDLLSVNFSDIGNDGSMRETRQRVPADGYIMLPYNVRALAAGRTTSKLQQEIRKAYVPDMFVNLTAVVTLEQRAYYVGGEVRLPTRQDYLGQMTVLRALETAGGFTDFANKKKIELRRENGQRIMVNWHKARKNDGLDPIVYPNDHIYVHRRGF